MDATSAVGRDWRVRVLGLWCAIALAAGLVSAGRSGGPRRSAVTATGHPSATTGTSSTTTSPTTPVTVETAATTPPSDAPSPGESVARTDTAPSGDDGGIGSVLDLGPRPVEVHDPAPCVPLAEMSNAAKLTVVDPVAKCGRVLVPAGATMGDVVTWAPDGSWLLTTVDFDVMKIAADGSWRQDLGGGGQAETAALSPDGTRIAITGNVPCCHLDERRVVVVANSDGTGAQTVQYDTNVVIETPVWSRDSSRFAYENNLENGPFSATALHVVAADGTEIAVRSFEDRGDTNAQTGETEPGVIGHLEWTSDGVLVAPSIIDHPTRKTLYWFNGDLSDAAGSDNPDVLHFSTFPSSSPDGSRVLYRGYDPENGSYVTQVWVLDRASGAATKVLQDATMPSWSPDGVHFVYATLDYSQQPYGVPRTISIGDLQGHTTPLWSVTDFNCYCWLGVPPKWSPNGALLAVSTH